MKHLLPVLLLCALSLRLIAQPVISNVETYNIGDYISLGDVPAVAAGPSGPGQVWNFSGIGLTDIVTMSVLAVPATSIYQSASMLEKYSDGVNYFMKTTPSQDYIVGMIDSSLSGGNDSVTYPDNVLAIVRPFTYNSSDMAPFTLHTYYPGVTGPVAGSGNIILTGDGYGSLLLPNGTYGNVLRVKVYEQSTYRLGSGGSITQTVHTYKWYDDAHTTPLLRIDSLVATYIPLSGIGNTSLQIKVRYLISSKNLLGVPLTENNPATNCRANIDHDHLSLFGNFDGGKSYDVNLYDVVGRKVFTGSFIANGNAATLNLGNQVNSGLYFLNLSTQNTPASKEVIKVIKL
jgi:hypothetical protein